MGKSSKRKHDQVPEPPTSVSTGHIPIIPKAAEVISSEDKQGQGDVESAKKQKGPVARVLFKHGISGVERSSKIGTSKDLRATSSKVAAKLDFPPDTDVRLVQVRDGGREAEIWDDFDFDAFRNRALANPSQRLIVKVYPAAGPSSSTAMTYSPSAYRTPQSQPAARPVNNPSTPTPASLPAKPRANAPGTPSNGNKVTPPNMDTARSQTTPQTNTIPTGSGVCLSGEGMSSRKIRRLKASKSLGEEGAASSPSSAKKDKKNKQRKKKVPTPLASPDIWRPAPTPPSETSIGKRKRSASPGAPSTPASVNTSAIPTSEMLTDDTTSEQPEKKKKKKKDKSLSTPAQGVSHDPSPAKSILPGSASLPNKTGRPSLLSKAHYQPARPSPLGQFSTSAGSEGNAVSPEVPLIPSAPTLPALNEVAVEVAPLSDAAIAPPPSKKQVKKRASTKPVIPEMPQVATSEVPASARPLTATTPVSTPKPVKPRRPNKSLQSSTATTRDLPQSPVPAPPSESDLSSVGLKPTERPSTSLEGSADTTTGTTSDFPMPTGKLKVNRPRIAKPKQPKAEQPSQTALLSTAIMAEFRALKAVEEAKRLAATQSTASLVPGNSSAIHSEVAGAVTPVNAAGEDATPSGHTTVAPANQPVPNEETAASTPQKKRKAKAKISTGETIATMPVISDSTSPPTPATPAEKPTTKRGRRSVLTNGTERDGVKEKKGKVKQGPPVADTGVPNTPATPAVGDGESTVDMTTPAPKGLRKREKAVISVPAETVASAAAGDVGNDGISGPRSTTQNQVNEATPVTELPAPGAITTVAEAAEPTTTIQSELIENTSEGISQSAPIPQIPVISKRAKQDKEKKGKETAPPDDDLSSSTITPGTADMDHPTPVIEAELVDADTTDHPMSPRITATAERDESSEAAPRAPRTTATPAKPTTPATSSERTISTKAVPLLIQPISTPSPGSSAKPAKKPLSKTQKYIKPPPLPRGESGGPEKPTCLICGVVISHMQKDCPIVLAGIDALQERLEVVKETPKSRDRTLALETIEGWMKRLDEIKKRREAFEAAQADAERDARENDSEEEEEGSGAGVEEDEMFAPPSPSSAGPTPTPPTTSPLQSDVARTDEEIAINTRETEVTPHPPMIDGETRSTPPIEHSPLPNPAALLPLSPIPSVSARPRSESSSSSATTSTSESTSSRSSVDSSEAVKTPNTAQPVSADPSLPAIFLRGLKKHHRPGSTSAVSVSTAFIETEDSDSASGPESISSSGEEEQEQDLDSESAPLENDEEMEGDADEDEDVDDDQGHGGRASSVIGASAVADSVLDDDDDMDGDDEADDISQTTSRVIGRLALPRHSTASRDATSTSPVIRPAETAGMSVRIPTSVNVPSAAKMPNPALDSTDAESDSDESSSDTSSPRSSVLPHVPSPTVQPSTAQPASTTELPDVETMFKQFFTRPLSQRERAHIQAASQGQQSFSLRPDADEGDDDKDDEVDSASEAPAHVANDDASSIGDFGSVAEGRDDSIEVEAGAGRVVLPGLEHAEVGTSKADEHGVEQEEDKASAQQDEGDDGEGDEDDEIRSDRTSVPSERFSSVPNEEIEQAPRTSETEDPIESDSPDDPTVHTSGPNGVETDSIPDLPLSHADSSLPSRQSAKSRRSASQLSANVITYSRRSARFKQLDEKGGESETIDEFAGSVAFAEARAEEATPELLSLSSQLDGHPHTSEDDAPSTPKARGRKITRSVSSSQLLKDDDQQTDMPDASLPNGSLTRRRSSRLRSAEVEVVIPVPPSRQRRASIHSLASQNGTSASQRTPKAPLEILVENSDELAQNQTPRAVKSSQKDQLDSSQFPQAQSQPVTPSTQKDRTIPATPTSRKVAKTLPPSSPATSARSTRSTSRSRAQSPLFMSQSQPLATQAYVARPQSLASSTPSLRTPIGAKAGMKGKKGEKVVTSPIVEEQEEEEKEADEELDTPRALLKANGKTQRDPLSSPSPPADKAENQPEEEEKEQEYFSQADLAATSNGQVTSPKPDGDRVNSEIPDEADIDEDDNEDEAASSIALPPILSRPIIPSSQPPPQSQMSFAPSLSSLPMDLLRSGVTAFAAFTGIGSQPVPKGPNGSSQSLIRDLDLGGGDEDESESGSGESSSEDDEGGRGRNGKGRKAGLRGRYVQSEKEKEAAKKRRARPLGW